MNTVIANCKLEGTVKRCACCGQNFIAADAKERVCRFCSRWTCGKQLDKATGKEMPVYRRPWEVVDGKIVFNKPNGDN